MATTPSKARLFIALDLPADARTRLVKWRRRAFAALEDDVRFVAPEALHVTLVFLGHLPEAEIKPISRLMRAAVPDADPPLLTATGVKPIPPRRPRLFALDLDDQADRAAAVQRSMSDALETAGLYEPEQRPFWPHVTLARVRKDAAAQWSQGGAPPPNHPWRAEGVTLYRSSLRREGARYEALERVELS